MTNAGVETGVTSPYLTSRGSARAWPATAATATITVTLFATMASAITITGGLVAEDGVAAVERAS